ncbi:MAG: class I mannose-6-phosphate isomerase [Clostridia bacterium]|nr:class I mannose-6-phosphate isomerase [Clostridia bacterium]
MDTAKLASLPVFFEKNRVFRVYLGGKLFSDFFGDNSEDGFYPEEWICSSTKALNEGSTDEFEGLSTVKGTGIRFNELIEKQKELMLGNRKGLDVLVKALDSAIRLPVQAHPDKAFSRKNFNSEFGKAESWLVLGAREDACIYFGFKDGVTKEDFEDAVLKSETDKSAMEKLLNKIPVKPGDVYFIPAKAVHAIGYGCLILEVQEPTDFTIQPERWCGDYKLSDNEMYLGLKKETALSVFDYSYNLEKVLKECKKTPAIIYENDGCKKECLISKADTPCFSVERYIVNNGETDNLLAPCVYVVTEGSGTLSGDGYEKDLKKGDYFFMPYSCKNKFTVKSSGKITVAACIPPEVE